MVHLDTFYIKKTILRPFEDLGRVIFGYEDQSYYDDIRKKKLERTLDENELVHMIREIDPDWNPLIGTISPWL